MFVTHLILIHPLQELALYEKTYLIFHEKIRKIFWG